MTGLMRAPQSRNMFTPVDDLQRGIFYTSDPKAISEFLHIGDAAPFIVVLDPPGKDGSGAAGDLPRPVSTGADLANNHLSYAVTWFGLAAALVVIFIIFARSRLRAGDAGAS